MNRVITVIQHQATGSLERFEPWLAGADVQIVRADLGEALPELDATHGVIVLGGPMSALDDAASPWLPAVRRLLADAVARDIPVLGICLGAQLLAAATGGQLEISAPTGPERGLVELRLRPGAENDPVLGGVVTALGRSIRASAMHADVVTSLPDGATWLASSVQYPFQAFRVGSAIGMEFHPEVSSEQMLAWARKYADLDVAALEGELAAAEEQLDTLAREVAEGFMAQVNRAALHVG